jgi:integrase
MHLPIALSIGATREKLKQIYTPPDAWTTAEFRQLYSATRRFRPGESYEATPCGLWWSCLLLIAFGTALRRRTLLAIRHRDIDLASGLLHIRGETTKTRQGQVFRLSDEAIDAIRAIWDPARDLLFTPIKPRTQYKHFDMLIDAAGISRHRRTKLTKFYALWRSTATLIAAAAGVGAASSILGHSEISVTKR